MAATAYDDTPATPTSSDAAAKESEQHSHRQLQSQQPHQQQHGNPKVIGNYIFQQSLGKGSMGKVKLAVHSVTGEKIAVKIVPRANFQAVTTEKDKKREENREIRTVREAHIMMLLRHPNIVGLKDLVTMGPYFYILMEYVSGGQLLHYIVKRQRLSERRSRHFARQITSALDYMHRNAIVHRDLKIENILIDKSGRNVKLIDFGLSNLFYPGHYLETFCGSLYFAAPELLKAQPYRGPEIDVWSLGVVIYVMVTGTVPFDDKSMPGLHEKIKKGHVTYPAHVSEECQDLLSRIFVTDPKERITIAEIIQHPWMNVDNTAVKNFLPVRKPITLPLDPHIIEKMTEGFNLGTEETIRSQLELLVQSEAYQAAAAHVQGGKTATSHPDEMSSEEYNFAVQHPLIAIYHLIRERQEQTISGTASIGRKPTLSRKASVESAFSVASARSSQVSLALSEDGRRPAASSLPHRPDYQLVADASVPGFTAQPSAAIGSTDYFARIQRWLRSSTSQHRLTPAPAQPASPEPTLSRQPSSSTTNTAGTSVTTEAVEPSKPKDPLPPPSPATVTTNTNATATATATPTTTPTPQKMSIFRKLSMALLRRKSSSKESAASSSPVHPETLRDRPLPPLPPVLDQPLEQTSQEPSPHPTVSKSSVSPAQAATRHKRSSSAASAQQAVHSLGDKFGTWLNRSSSFQGKTTT